MRQDVTTGDGIHLGITAVSDGMTTGMILGIIAGMIRTIMVGMVAGTVAGMAVGIVLGIIAGMVIPGTIVLTTGLALVADTTTLQPSVQALFVGTVVPLAHATAPSPATAAV